MSQENELKVASLGRPSFLGQAYDARTGKLLNFSLFTADAMAAATQVANAGNVVNKYKEVRETSDKSSLLDLSPSNTVSILGGAIDARYRAFTTEQHRLKTEDAALQSSLILAPDKVDLLGASHVVTAITYGSAMIASLSETDHSRQTSNKLADNMSVKLLQDLGALGGAEGEVKLSDEDIAKLKGYELDLRMSGDFLTDKVPVNEVALIEMLSRSGRLLIAQVPIHLTLTNLRLFDNISAEVFYRDLEEERLVALIKLYDDLKTLSQRWNFMTSLVQQQGNGLFPSIKQECDNRSTAVELMVIQYRSALGAFMRDYRDESKAVSEANVKAFTQEEWTPKIAEQIEAYGTIASSWKDVLQVQEYTTSRDFPLSRVDEVLAQISESHKQVALVLIPPSSSLTALIDLFEGLSAAVPRAGGSADSPFLCSIYADPLLVPDILLLDGPTQSIQLSLAYSNSSGLPTILTRGLQNAYPAATDWRSAQRDGWGITLNTTTGTKYTGNLSEGLPHGQGRAIYSDKRVYDGGWYRGQWDGHGVLTQNGSVLESGIFVDGAREVNGLMVNVTVYDAKVPVDSVVVAVVCHDVTSSKPTILAMKAHVPRQITKIAGALGWKVGERYRLRTTWETQQVFERPSFSLDDPIYDPELVPLHYDLHKSTTTVTVKVTAGEVEMEAFEYDAANESLKEVGFILETNDNIWLDGEVAYLGLKPAGTMLEVIRQNVKELGPTIMLEAERLP